MKPFHLSVIVPDLGKAREFYLNILRCELGRDKGDWIDILFFGHQLTLHQENTHRAAMSIDHFGPVLDKGTWLEVAQNLVSHNVEFVMQPKLMLEGLPDESGKFLVNDPAGNLLEFKFYGNFGKTVAEIS